MKILITGSKGQLGNELQDIIKSGKCDICNMPERVKEYEVIALDVGDLDITSFESVKKVLEKEKPEKLIIVGGPPCQPFSKAGYWVTNEKRNSCSH